MFQSGKGSPRLSEKGQVSANVLNPDSPPNTHSSLEPCPHVGSPPTEWAERMSPGWCSVSGPCAQGAPLTCAFGNDLRSLQTQSSVAVRIWLVSGTLMPIYNSSCSSFLVPRLAIKWFNWPWNVDCKLWLEKTRDSRVIFPLNLALTCQAFFVCLFPKDFFFPAQKDARHLTQARPY